MILESYKRKKHNDISRNVHQHKRKILEYSDSKLHWKQDKISNKTYT